MVDHDRATHRIRILCVPGLEGDLERACHHRLQHMAFRYSTLDDLLSTYARLKSLKIEPVRTANQGATISFYYLDPDGNCIELLSDSFCDWEKSGEYMRTSPEFAAIPIGTFVDADKMIAARLGSSPEELHLRACAGEFSPSKPMRVGAMIRRTFTEARLGILTSLKACEASYAAFIETINARRPNEVSKKSISAKRKPGYPPEEVA